VVRQKIESGTVMAQAMQSKLESTKINLLAAEKFLEESLQIIQNEGQRVKSDLD